MSLLHTLLAREEESGPAPACETGNEYDGNMGVRISAIFVILVGSSFGALFPILARRFGDSKIGSWLFFIAKYFGSGVIIATAFIHLLAPAEEALKNECLTGPITEYSWVEGIILMTIAVLFFVELMVMRYARFGSSHGHGHGHAHSHTHGDDHGDHSGEQYSDSNEPKDLQSHILGEDHLGHSREHEDPECGGEKDTTLEDYAAQLTSIFILEFGVIFHSIFIGLTLAVSGEEFTTLYIVLVFHQTFEGLGLGSRLATIPWPQSKRWTPYILGALYGLSTPIAIAVGLGVRTSYPPEGFTTLVVNGVFDSISAGILIYTALVELLAHEFMFSTSMRKAPIHHVLAAFFLLCLGALLMALLGKWA
ncbi:putative plasma membrane low affinity zinc ion transporter [Aspergillus taichungensis]|uniref:Putative plasma membrane low affinity zinc ion transporter n=1 Tax=Aspergillus taichungensis TaxID=482145 RepID=A0A2J5HUN8_9EURO|nr:putative plasma membrane low affinity zinc ion transporter [Aspergillus taichungensis]